MKINIHSSLTRFTENERQTELVIDKTSNILSVLCQRFERLKANILDNNGELTPFINIYVNGKNINQLEDMPLNDNDTIDVITSLVGG